MKNAHSRNPRAGGERRENSISKENPERDGNDSTLQSHRHLPLRTKRNIIIFLFVQRGNIIIFLFVQAGNIIIFLLVQPAKPLEVGMYLYALTSPSAH